MDCNERIQNIKYNAELLTNQARLEKQLSMVNTEIKKKQSECNHINIILGADESYNYKKCLFCEKVMIGKSDLYPTIDAATYKLETYGEGRTIEERNRRLEDLRNLAVYILRSHPNMREEEFFSRFETEVKIKRRIKE